MFQTLLAYWTDPLIHAVSPISRTFVISSLAIAFGWIALSIRGAWLKKPYAIITGLLFLFFVSLPVAEMFQKVRLAQDLQEVLASPEVLVKFDGKRILLIKPSWEEKHFLGRFAMVMTPEITVEIWRDALPRIEAVLRDDPTHLAINQVSRR